ncbi:chorismate mutase [Candidatus Peregrinibacteria bacterium]|jgi:chorismate mutase|nr:chorismate mutase [Candidatus Peregrinibacteria bacterium]MBT4148299.1 chorismate mutase [Candidatus Peregrinibacteria bacterium]MBT4366436.1 chorismate mutase [Candidatus Peregrinibacteria bacterium]MBT4456202.1 chorismate mutase [Candidatus Peregrinibacteria bacterium]
MTKDLRKWRKKIDRVDKKLEKLLAKREKLVVEIGKIKKSKDLDVEQLSREKEVFSKIKNPRTKRIFKEIIKISKESQSKL